ncbi:Esterase FE4 [Gryllus bimaculatus]|nr:Esterase FE4 [Gryllus bimaculatus]
MANGDFLLEHGDMVLVSVQYRLGPMGFLQASEADAPGNAALHDLHWALKWVSQHIHLFGGDPKHIVAGGVSAGAALSGLLTVSPVTRGLLAGTALFSGGALVPWTVDADPWRSTRGVGVFAGCLRPDNLAECLRTRSTSALQRAWGIWTVYETYFMNHGMGGVIPSLDPTSSSPLLPRAPLEEMMDENFEGKPLLVGVTKHEGTFLMTRLVDFTGAGFFKGPAQRTAQLNAQRGGDSYLFSFEYAAENSVPSSLMGGDADTVHHGSDQYFLFDSGSDFTERDNEIVNIYCDLVASFVINLKPQVEGVNWRPHTTFDDYYLAVRLPPVQRERFSDMFYIMEQERRGLKPLSRRKVAPGPFNSHTTRSISNIGENEWDENSSEETDTQPTPTEGSSSTNPSTLTTTENASEEPDAQPTPTEGPKQSNQRNPQFMKNVRRQQR